MIQSKREREGRDDHLKDVLQFLCFHREISCRYNLGRERCALYYVRVEPVKSSGIFFYVLERLLILDATGHCHGVAVNGIRCKPDLAPCRARA